MDGDRLFDCLEYAIISDPESDLTWMKDGEPFGVSPGIYYDKITAYMLLNCYNQIIFK